MKRKCPGSCPRCLAAANTSKQSRFFCAFKTIICPSGCVANFDFSPTQIFLSASPYPLSSSYIIIHNLIPSPTSLSIADFLATHAIFFVSPCVSHLLSHQRLLVSTGGRKGLHAALVDGLFLRTIIAGDRQRREDRRAWLSAYRPLRRRQKSKKEEITAKNSALEHTCRLMSESSFLHFSHSIHAYILISTCPAALTRIELCQ